MLYLKDLKFTKYYLNTIYSYCTLANTIIKKIHNAKVVTDGSILIDLRDNEN